MFWGSVEMTLFYVDLPCSGGPARGLREVSISGSTQGSRPTNFELMGESWELSWPARYITGFGDSHPKSAQATLPFPSAVTFEACHSKSLEVTFLAKERATTICARDETMIGSRIAKEVQRIGLGRRGANKTHYVEKPIRQLRRPLVLCVWGGLYDCGRG